MQTNLAQASMYILDVWAIRRSMVTPLAQMLGTQIARAMGGAVVHVDTLAMAPQRRRESPGPTARSVRVIPVHGLLAPRTTATIPFFSGTSYEQVQLDLAAAIADPGVGSIVLDFDSDGGSMAGASELAAAVRAARDRKPIIAQAAYDMCSGAYWIAAGASEVVAAPSASVGSIGVYAIHEDLSKALEDAGIQLTIISAGLYKTATLQGQPLTDVGRDNLERRINAAHDRFVADVAAGRRVDEKIVRQRFGKGLTFTAEAARAAGLIDRIATLDETVGRASRLTSSPAGGPGAMARQRAQQREILDSLHTLTVRTPAAPSSGKGPSRRRVH